MAVNLSEGALEKIMTGGEVKEPVMQILGTKKIQGNGTDDRYRLHISDGRFSHTFAMLASQHNPRLLNGELDNYTVIQIDRYITSVMNNTGGKGEKRVLIILDFSVLVAGNNLKMKIGNPRTWQEGGSSTSAAASAPAATFSTPAVAPRPAATAPTSSNVSIQSSGHSYIPINGLSPYQNRWVIKARVMSKSAIRTWSNSKGEGKLFSMDLCDESGEIRATAFKDQCDKFYDMIEPDKVYYISRCTLKPANKKFSNLKNDYEMSFTNDTVVEECTDSSGSIPEIQYNFISINDIANKNTNDLIDVVGVCKSSTDVIELQSRDGRQLKKRDLTLIDSSSSAVTLTMWGDNAVNFDGSQQPIVLIRSARVSEFNGGKSLSIIGSSVVRINPDVPEAHKLRGWYDNGGSEIDAVNMSARTGGPGGGSSDWITFSDAEERQIGSSEKGDYYNVVGILTYINTENALYKACPQEQCNKKVTDQENGLFRCEKCNRDYPNYKYRIIMSGYVSDHSGDQWVTMFNETAETIVGKKADELGRALETNKKEYTAMFEDITFRTFLFRIRTKMENFSDETRLKSTVMSAQPIDYKDANSRLIKDITATTGIRV